VTELAEEIAYIAVVRIMYRCTFVLFIQRATGRHTTFHFIQSSPA